MVIVVLVLVLVVVVLVLVVVVVNKKDAIYNVNTNVSYVVKYI